jgi:nucleotide-binding universal stress UspA family protein
MKFETPEQVGTTAATAGQTSRNVIELAPLLIHLENILVPLDFSETSLKSLQYAVPFAQQFGAKLTLLHVVQPPAYTPELPIPAPLTSEQLAAISKRLEDIRASKIPPEVPVESTVRHNFIFDGIMEVAREIRADLIITTTHGHTGLKHLLMGSTAESIVRKAPCPVLVVREREHDFV